MKTIYKVGDRVKIKSTLSLTGRYVGERGKSDPTVVSDMADLRGVETVITRVTTAHSGEVYYNIGADKFFKYNWTAAMLEKVEVQKEYSPVNNFGEFFKLARTADEILPNKIGLFKLIVSNRATVSFFLDTTNGNIHKVIAKCQPGDSFNLEAGLKICSYKLAIKLATKELKKF